MPFDKSSLSAKLDDIQSLNGVRAVEPGGAPAAQESPAVAAQTGISGSDAKAFEAAGWTFVEAKQAAEPGRGVVVDSDGHLKILSDALNVKFDPSLSRDAVEGILSQHGLSIRRDMKFAPNLFLVEGKTDNTVSTAKSLNRRDDVVYAEPVLIEPLKGR